MLSTPTVLIDALSVSSGGGRTYVVNLFRELARDPRGFRFHVLAEPGSLGAEGTCGLPLEPVHLPRRPRAARVALRVLYEETALALRARRFDLLYCPADLSPLAATTPTVVALRNLNIYDRTYYDTPRLRVLSTLARVGLRRARRVIVPTKAAGTLIARSVSLDEDLVAVVPHGVSPEFAEAAGEAEAGAPYLFLPAALERHKNLEVLIRALPLLTGDLRLRVAGGSDTDPEYAEGLLRLVSDLRLEGRVDFLGPLPYQRIAALYRGARALVFPSKLETFGHPLLEAMLLGTPIVAADIPAFREVAGDAALYFDPDDATALAAALRSLEADASGRRLRRDRGHDRAASFSWRRSTDRLCDVLRETLSQG